MNIENPEIRTQVLEWQKRHNIRDDDPAMALLELLNVYYKPEVKDNRPSISSEEISRTVSQATSQAVRQAVTPPLERLASQVQAGAHSSISPEILSNTIKTSLTPAVERITSLIHDIERSRPTDIKIPVETISEAIRTAILPSIDNMSFQAQELKKKLESMNLDQFSTQIGAYHDGIDYCTKKLDVVKKESESLLVGINKASSSIKPVTKGAVVFLMALSGVVGFILRMILFNA